MVYNELNVPGPEFRVRPVVRWVVTRFCHAYQNSSFGGYVPGGSEVIGEFENESRAHEVSDAMQRVEDRQAEAVNSMSPVCGFAVPE